MSADNSSVRNGEGIDWQNVIYFLPLHIIGVRGFIMIGSGKVMAWTIVFNIIIYYLCVFALAGGYHRLFTHRSFVASLPLKIFFLVQGAACGLGSAISWCAAHHPHHLYVDKDSTDDERDDKKRDPHSIKRGFWWAQIFWTFRRYVPDRSYVRYLSSDPLVAWQDRHFNVLFVVYGFIVPTVIPILWGESILVAFLIADARILFQFHITSTANSVSHMWGLRTYDKAASACCAFVFGLLNGGEGIDHGYHHFKPKDVRAGGVKWWYPDMTYWLLVALRKFGLASGFVYASREEIEVGVQASSIEVSRV